MGLAKTAYQTLGVNDDADLADIKHAYYDLRKKFAALKRPNKAQCDRLVRITEAWDILKISERREPYDAELHFKRSSPEKSDVEVRQKPRSEEPPSRQSTRESASADARAKARTDYIYENAMRGRRPSKASGSAPRTPAVRGRSGIFWGIASCGAFLYLMLEPKTEKVSSVSVPATITSSMLPTPKMTIAAAAPVRHHYGIHKSRPEKRAI